MATATIPTSAKTARAAIPKPTTPAAKTPGAQVAKPAGAAQKSAVSGKISVAAKPAKPTKPPKPAKPAKPARPKKPKLVRDSFTIPKPEYLVLDELKQRSIKLARPAKKSELLRAGIKALAGMTDAGLLAALQAVPAIKTGRPANT